MVSKNANDPNYIYNPKTKKWVRRDRSVGKSIIAALEAGSVSPLKAGKKSPKRTIKSPSKPFKEMTNAELARQCEIYGVDCHYMASRIINTWTKLIGQQKIDVYGKDIGKLLDCCDKMRFQCRKKVIELLERHVYGK